jgi:dolichol kinase
VKRALFHLSAALVSLLFAMVLFTPTQLPWAAAVFAVTFWSLEGLRRIVPRTNDALMTFFRHVARPSERHRVNSATWYMTALLLLASTGSTLLSVVGVAVLGFADPAAATVGRRFGRVKLANNRTLEGSLTFVIVGTAAAFVALMLLAAPPPAPLALAVALAAATSGALAELFARRVDDNFLIPLVAAGAAAVLLRTTGHWPGA